MKTLNELWVSFLEKRGFTGPLPEAQYNWLGALGFTGTLNERFKKYLASLGFPGVLPNAMYNWLGSLGYEGAFNDRLFGYLSDYQFMEEFNLTTNAGEMLFTNVNEQLIAT